MKLATLIRDRWPAVEIVLTSGHITPKIAELPACCVFLPKPYRSEEVIAALRKFGKAPDKTV